VCEDGRALQEVWMVLEFCNRGTLSDAIARGWLLSGGVALVGRWVGVGAWLQVHDLSACHSPRLHPMVALDSPRACVHATHHITRATPTH
jgi:hypothetical protein